MEDLGAAFLLFLRVPETDSFALSLAMPRTTFACAVRAPPLTKPLLTLVALQDHGLIAYGGAGIIISRNLVRKMQGLRTSSSHRSRSSTDPLRSPQSLSASNGSPTSLAATASSPTAPLSPRASPSLRSSKKSPACPKWTFEATQRGSSPLAKLRSSPSITGSAGSSFCRTRTRSRRLGC